MLVPSKLRFFAVGICMAQAIQTLLFPGIAPLHAAVSVQELSPECYNGGVQALAMGTFCGQHWEGDIFVCPQGSVSLLHISYHLVTFAGLGESLRFALLLNGTGLPPRVNLVMHLFSGGLPCVTFPGET